MAALRTVKSIVSLFFVMIEALLAVGLAALLGPVVLPVALASSSRMVRKAVFAAGLVITVGAMVIGVAFTPAEFQAFRGAF